MRRFSPEESIADCAAPTPMPGTTTEAPFWRSNMVRQVADPIATSLVLVLTMTMDHVAKAGKVNVSGANATRTAVTRVRIERLHRREG